MIHLCRLTDGSLSVYRGLIPRNSLASYCGEILWMFNMTDEELMDKAVDALVNAFIVMFRSVGYPVRPLYYSEGGITLEIRVPPTLPDFIMKKYPRFRDGFRACPSIELIGIPYEWQGCGFFTKLVNALGAEPSVECVCISCVTNEVFSQKLQNNPEWELLYYSELFDVKGFYKVFKRD